MPRVVLSAGNISHYHHAALVLQQSGYLWKYLCVFNGKDDLGIFQNLLPTEMRKRLSGKALSGLDNQKIHTIALPYLFTQSLRRAKLMGQARTDALFGMLYDMATLYKVDGADIFHFINSVGLKTAERVKKKGCVTICDIRAEHVDHQEAILQIEYDYLGLPYRSMRMLYRDRLIAEYTMADFLIVPSAYIAETFLQLGYPHSNLFVVPYGVAPEYFPGPKAHLRKHDRKHPFRILFVGQIIPLKGLHYLIQALENIKIPDLELVVIGSGDVRYLNFLRSLISSNVSIRFMGHIPQMDVWQYYLESDVLVLPSLSDSFGMVVSEAMTTGLPVIVSENTGAKEIVRDGTDGFIVPIRNPHVLEEKLTFLYENPEERQEMGWAASNHVKEYTWERYRERLLDVYDRILTGM